MYGTHGTSSFSSQRGASALGIIFVIILILVLIFLCDQAFIFLSEECMGEDAVECLLGFFGGGDEKEAPHGAVTATGAIGGEYGGEQREVTVTLTFPLEGGAVSGSFSGDCDGSIKGTYAGGNGGAISGTARGKCAWVLPASGSFSGSVNQTTKKVPISGSGSAAGFSGQGSLTLSY